MFHLNNRSAFIALALLLVLVIPVLSAAQGSELEPVVIQTSGALNNLRRLIESAGGQVTRQYDNLNALAAELPVSAFDTIRRSGGVVSIAKDALVASPGSVFAFGGRNSPETAPQAAGPLDNIPHTGSALIHDLAEFAQSHPGAYRMNHSADNVQALHAGARKKSEKSEKSKKSKKSNKGNAEGDDGPGDDKDDGHDNTWDANRGDSWNRPPLSGKGVIVAVLDTGLRPNFGHFDSTMPGPTVIGCDDFVVFDGKGCVSPDNDGHGTMVSGVIAAGATFGFTPTSTFLNSVGFHAPDAVLDSGRVAIVGSAPGAQIYMIKVFVDSLTPTPSSVILSAVDHIIFLKREGVDIQVANLSLGTRTLYAGKSVFDMAHDALLKAGIVPVASAGNAGPALLTIASPASAYSSIAVGAGSLAHQERIAADVGFFNSPGLGELLRPFPDPQTAWFSSRGPHADGRLGPEVMSDGFGVYGAGLGLDTETVSLGNGTSFSAPNVTGIVALLREAFPRASATQIRNAIVKSGNKKIINNGADKLDEGNGWVDALEAYELLKKGKASGRLPRPPRSGSRVAQNVDQRVRSGNVRTRINNLQSGEREDILYNILPNYAKIQVEISDVSVRSNRCTPNVIFGDELRLAIHTAKTSALGPSGNYFVLNSPAFPHAFISVTDPDDPQAGGVLPGACGNGVCKFVLDNPEPGLARISLSGATENACRMSAKVSIQPVERRVLSTSISGKISDGGIVFHSFDVEPGIEELEFDLRWDNNWSRYPANDLDLLLFSPFGGPPLPFGQTLDSPESFVLTPTLLGAVLGAPGPVALDGAWGVGVLGFEVNEAQDRWALRVTADGTKLTVN